MVLLDVALCPMIVLHLYCLTLILGLRDYYQMIARPPCGLHTVISLVTSTEGIDYEQMLSPRGDANYAGMDEPTSLAKLLPVYFCTGLRNKLYNFQIIEND